MFAGIGFSLGSFLSCVSVFVFVRCVCVAGKSKVRYHPPHPPLGGCMQVQGTLSSPPTHPTQTIQPVLAGCVQVQGMLPSPPTHPTHPTYPHQIRMVVCVQVQGTLSSHTTPPTHPTHPTCIGRMYASPRYVTIHPPTRPTQRGASERKTEAQVIHARRK